MVFLPNQIIFSLPSRKQNLSPPPLSKNNNFFPEMSQTIFFIPGHPEDPFNCETGMRGSRVGLQ